MQNTEILMTEDYDIFKSLPGNRPLDERHVTKLMAAMEKNDLFTPITVNEKLEIIDGQHRLEARRRLKLIVPYMTVNGYGLNEVQAINAGQKSWTVADYAQSYIALGNENYRIYEWFRRVYKLPHVVSVELLSGTPGHGQASESFHNGTFTVRQLSSAKQSAEMLQTIAPFFSAYNRRSFVLALLSVSKKKCFVLEKFIRKLESNSRMMTVCASTDQYIDLIEQIYNYNSRTKVSLKYGE